MNILFWNVRGLGNQPSKLVLKELYLTHKSDCLLLAEPWINFNSIPIYYSNFMGLNPQISNQRMSNNPMLWFLCKSHLNPTFMDASSQHITFSVSWNEKIFYCSTMYANTNHVLQRRLWMDLTTLQQYLQGIWLFLRDFNAILREHECRGGRLPLPASYDNFQAWTDASALNHIDTIGALYAQSNGRHTNRHIEAHLDRAIDNDDCLDSWDSLSCCNLTRSQSNHFSLLVVLKFDSTTFSSSFKFYSMWTSHPDYRYLV